MSVYKHKVNNFHRKKNAHRFKRFAQISFALFFIASAVVAVDWLINKVNSSNSVVTTENISSVQAASISVYRTELFQFQAPEAWVMVASQSTDKKYVYFKKDEHLVTERLTVYVDLPVSDNETSLSITNVIPVTVVNGRRFDFGEVSGHCGQSVPDTVFGGDVRTTLDTVSFVCARSSKQYNVLVGQREGNESIEFINSLGEEVRLTIVYSNLTAYPGPGDLRDIVSSFEVL